MDVLRAMWKGTISFGLVTIPVKLYTATESKDLRFNLLHEPCQTPIQYRKYCPSCDREVESGEIVKGYEFERGRYVTLRDEDFESIPPAARRTLEIVAFVRLEEIDPVYFDKTYYLEPGEGGAKAYALLRHAMEVTGRVAIARVVLRAKESLAALRVFRDGVLALETMHFPDEVRSVAGLTGIAQPELRPQEIEMARGLIESLTMPFTPERFENEYRKALLELIQDRIAGAPPAAPGPVPEQGRVVDLMEALRASIRAAEAQRAARGQAPAAGLPPAGGQPSVNGQPSAVGQPAVAGHPPAVRQPAVDGQSPAVGRPAAHGQPSADGQPTADVQGAARAPGDQRPAGGPPGAGRDRAAVTPPGLEGPVRRAIPGLPGRAALSPPDRPDAPVPGVPVGDAAPGVPGAGASPRAPGAGAEPGVSTAGPAGGVPGGGSAPAAQPDETTPGGP